MSGNGPSGTIIFIGHLFPTTLAVDCRRNQRGEGETSPALNKDENFVPEFSLKDYEFLTSEH